jgi:Lon protease-like protein
MQPEPNRVPSGPAATFHIPDLIPVFPLPNVVFFPRMYLPLHIFEPRYREMVADAADGDRCVGMVLLKEGWEEEYYGTPPIYEIGCVGRLVSVEPLPDGRFNILLQGLHRFEIREQLFDRSYRRARIRLKTGGEGGFTDRAMRADLVRIAQSYLTAKAEGHHWQELFRQNVDDEVLVHSLSTYLDLTPIEKQFLMEAETLQQRARRLTDLLQFKLHERDDAKGWG